MSLAEALALAVQGRELPEALLAAAFDEIVGGEAPPAQIAGLLVALRTKGETTGEIVAVARALRARAERPEKLAPDAIDTCGTGGDGAGTFNISTCAALVAAGAGVRVAKHGNRAISSRTGSIDVLEALGVGVELSVRESAQILADVGFAPFFAQRAHPAMAALGPVRRALGLRTLMNGLGPLLNPMGVRRQLVGVYAPELVEPMAEALGRLGAERAMVVHGSDGLDEITTSGTTRAAVFEDAAVRRFEIDPADYGIARADPGQLRGGDPAENAATLRAILAGESGAPRDIVLLNAAAALVVADRAADLGEGVRLAGESIDSGRAAERLAALVAATGAGR